MGVYAILAVLFVVAWFETWRRFADRPGQSEPARLVRTLQLVWGTIAALVVFSTGIALVVSIVR